MLDSNGGREMMPLIRRMLGRLWEIARGVLGDNAYELYVSKVRQNGGKPMAPREFYLSQIQARYSRPSRCC